jgi:protein SCO1
MALFVSLGCARPQPGTRYRLAGLVMSVEPERQVVDIAHEAIDGLMPAMAMPFTVRGTLPALSPDDRVTATLVVTATESWLEDLVVTARGSTAAARPATSLAGRLEGSRLPDVRLRNHDDRPFTFGALAGRVVMVTFIYTRCPLPDYCPRMMSHLATVMRAVEATPALAARTRFVAVTLDPAFDTPAVLTAYGARTIGTPDRLARLDLVTGPAAEIQALAGFFGVKYRQESGQISHSLATAVVGADGRVVKLFPGNGWAPDEALAAITAAAGNIQ